MKNNKTDNIEHPSHYNRKGAMECFDEFVLLYGVEAAKHACLFNIHKYRYRAADKNGAEDLAKSDWYIKKYKELSQQETIAAPTPLPKEIPYDPNRSTWPYPWETPWTVGDWPPGPQITWNASITPCNNNGQK